MELTRKQFLDLAGRGAIGAAVSCSTFDFLAAAQARQAEEVLDSPEVRKVHQRVSSKGCVAWRARALTTPARRRRSSSTSSPRCSATSASRPSAPGTRASRRWPSSWSSPPLEARRVKNFAGFPEVIVARGAINSKGGNRFVLNAMESIIAVHGKLPVNVIFTCDGAEEQGSPNFHEVLDPWRDRLRRANCLMNLGPSQQADGQVSMSLGNKGIMYIELEAHGARWGRGPQKMPIHSSRKAILDSPVWRLVDVLRSMYDPAKNEILIAGFKDAIRPPNEEEIELMKVLTTRFRDRLFGSERENVKAFMNDWTPEEAAYHLTFDTTLNIDGLWAGYTGPGVATILPEKAAVKIDARLVPNQEVGKQADLVRAHLDRHGFSDIELRRLGGGDEWSQTSVKEPVVQATLAMYRRRKIEPMVWPRSAGSSPQWEYTRKLGLPAGGGGL
ncbi:MAG TPA: peptidase dimerization domain-containing protein, partial [Vicinamibacterales bacterium]|nr:peptidase dimerization domain-containing protein [Vicinamibacterales bacterium]